MGLPITVWRTAYDQKRPYLDLGDATRAIALAIEAGRDGKLEDGAVYNVLTCNATVRDVVEAIRTVRPELNVSFVDNKIMNQLSYEVRADRFGRLGFAPEGDLGRAVAQTLALLDQANAGARA